MPPVVSASFKQYLKSSNNMKLSSDASVTRVTYEGLTNFESLQDFDKKTIEKLPSICKEKIHAINEDIPAGISSEPEIAGANVSSVSVRRLVVASFAAKYYKAVGRNMTAANMHYQNVLAGFKADWEAYMELKKDTAPEAPSIMDRDNDRKVIKWAPIFKDCLSRTFGHRGPLSYVLRDDATVLDEAYDPLKSDATTGVINSYFGLSGGLQDELVSRLKHTGPIYKQDNASVFLLIEKASRNTSVESTVKAFARTKDGRGAFLAIIKNHAGETKYRAIHKKRMNLLQNVKWNGRGFELEKHVSSHRQAVDDLMECANHITCVIPDQSQRVEYIIDSISCNDITLQAALGLIRANTNNMRNDFELCCSTLIEVDPYRRSQKSSSKTPLAQISGIDFSAGRGSSGVDLRWHHPKEFKALSSDKKTELCNWQKTQDGKKSLKKSRLEAEKRQAVDWYKEGGAGKGKRGGNTTISDGAWKKKLKRAVKTKNGFKTIMSVLAEEESTNQALVNALTAGSDTKSSNTSSVVVETPKSPETKFPATTLKLSSILKKN